VTTSSRKFWRPFLYLADLFERKMILPTPRMVGITIGTALLVGLGFVVGLGIWALLLINAGLLAASVLDLSLLPRRGQLSFRRELTDRADIDSPFEVKILARARMPLASLKLEVQDDLPQTFQSPKGEMSVRWQGKTAELSYATAGRERGDFNFRYLRVRLHGPLRLWIKQMKVPLEQQVAIIPDLSDVRGALASMQNQLIFEGRKVSRRERSGSELHAIREYIPDDDPRMINWRATARSGTLMTSVFRPERGKIVTILLDCGRLMGIELDNRTKLDTSLEAALSLAAVALKQGDKVALLAFSNTIKTYIPPGQGIKHLQTIIDAVYRLQSDFVEASYSVAFQYLIRVQKKRSLIVLFSDIANEMFDERLRSLLLRTRRQHYLLLIGLRDEVLHHWTLIESKTGNLAFTKSLAHKFTLDRQAHLAKIRAVGVEALDVPVGELAWNAVNRYLEIKSNDLL
jgi:uncharacterized protein (DUF58 family)